MHAVPLLAYKISIQLTPLNMLSEEHVCALSWVPDGMSHNTYVVEMKSIAT